MKKPELLVVDDERDTCELLEMALSRQGMQVTTSTTASDALEMIAARDFDVVLTDLSMPQVSGLEVCERVLAVRPEVPVVVITGYGTLETAMGAIRAGAYDFVTKPIESKTLGVVVSRAVQHRRLREQIRQLRAARDASQTALTRIIGGSPAMRKVADLIERVGDSDASVLIHGETGTGKELVARAVHQRSRRREGPFVAINCAAVPHSLLESELFGHARGAFTDAKAQRTGLFVQAQGGTLFLDEIGELPLDVQPKLLRALQERKVRPVGDNREIPFDARIVAATNRDLENEVREKRFREDLYYRINVVKIEVPPLRARGADTLHLAQHFLEQFAERSGKPTLRLSERAAERLMAYEWPGNVRELENTIEHAVALARFDQITVEDLPEKLRGYLAGSFVATANDPTEIVTMEELERRYLLRVFKLVGNNKSRAAEVLGIDRRTMYRKLERYAAREAETGDAVETPSPSEPAASEPGHAVDRPDGEAATPEAGDGAPPPP
ncbi:MAG: sigma-54-dependent Fis family transcriptional regulator [Labilithrix sp.]|nr:sigma-54-dependent Fis family transcriptional regulator [Labilithrix sp.]